MDLNAYFPQLSPVSSLWSPLQAVIPVLHWMASLWLVPPGWEPKLVSLAPFSHNICTKNLEEKGKQKPVLTSDQQHENWGSGNNISRSFERNI
ncbi:hypothetical protein DSO57_1032015 [Entomophthora muscae]|uniref:Uncharacterized protein n=1 Tax=Entomophthora muscae TaxID=34485 RepID=A0ACC2T0G4_9FUNG|nr:hypothetical protein DSO57_1032015 [Entomophthora muscae]